LPAGLPAADAHQRQADEADQLARQAELAAAEIKARRREFSQRSARLTERQESVRERKESCETAAGELPAGYRVNAPLIAGELADASERVRRRRTELTKISGRLEETRTVIDQAGRDLETLNGQLQAEVDVPARQLILKLSAAERRLNDLAALLGMPSAPARPGGSLLRGRPGTRRERDHRPAGAGHHRRPGVRLQRWSSCARPGTGYRYPPWPAGCSGWASRPPSRRTWPWAGHTVPSGRCSRPGQRPASWARMNFLVWLIRSSGAVEGRPSAEHRCENRACRAVARSVRAATVDSEHYSQIGRDSLAKGRQPAAQPAGQPTSLVKAQHGDGVPGADADDDAAVAAYRLSVKAGNPLSQRKLAQMFGRTSRRWGRARITEARQGP